MIFYFERQELEFKSLNYVKIIHKQRSLCGYSWSKLVGHPHLLVQYNYLDQLLTHWFDISYSDPHYHYKRYLVDFDIFWLVETAVIFRRLEIIKYIVEVKQNDLSKHSIALVETAAKHGNMEIIQYIQSKVDPKVPTPYRLLLCNACTTDNLELIQSLSEKVSPSEDYSFGSTLPITNAVKHGNLEIIQWLLPRRLNDKKSHPYNLLAAALINKHYHVADWLHDNGYLFNTVPLGLAFNGLTPSQHLFEWLRKSKIKFEYSGNDLDFAAGGPSLDLVRWIHSNTTCSCSKNAMYNAFYNYRFDVFKWLHENRTEGCKQISGFSRNVPVDQSTPLEMVSWFHHNRSEGFTALAMDSAARFSHDIVKFLHSNRTEGFTGDALLYSIVNNNLETFKFLRENSNSVEIPVYLCDDACGLASLEMIKYLHENCTQPNLWSFRAMDKAVQENRMEVVRFLHENRTEGCSYRALKYSIHFQSLEMVQYLLDNKLVEFNEDIILNEFQKGNPPFRNIEMLNWLIMHPNFNRQKLIDKAVFHFSQGLNCFLKDYDIDIIDYFDIFNIYY
ncbi:hypothetical protein PPL_00335 [Heterostelium album PN500]|uniref:Ankyrin repeat protein n=1 Tax=Heterostelium pallidum (strain ATCC 26659 / Pp 5 / PN500) TaxID=670386 RepID=D3AW63_HETP5|nr:hypothetical protein PPL_00335 [Heterostelium album PN500]EFA86536.1 hypothetical protein PPL_00335 [Heterostelium album PN500]|eukprot:XP_020438641.1 hypothetical protein PPL_00335 [Heterostelium album PN500]